MKLSALFVLLAVASPVAAAGSKALIYCGASDCIEPPMQLQNTLTGAGAQVDHLTVLPTLDDYRIVFVIDPMAGIAADETTLQAFHDAGGTLVLVGECAQWTGKANSTINELLTKLGSPLQIVTDAKEPDASCTEFVAQPSASPVMAGVDGLKFAWTSTVTAPSAQVLATYNGDVIAAGDPSARVFVVGDANVFLDECSFTPTGNDAFIANLWAASAPSTSGSNSGSDGNGSGSSSDGMASSGCQTGNGVGCGTLALVVLALRRRPLRGTRRSGC